MKLSWKSGEISLNLTESYKILRNLCKHTGGKNLAIFYWIFKFGAVLILQQVARVSAALRRAQQEAAAAEESTREVRTC